jgi:hypothetical protein
LGFCLTVRVQRTKQPRCLGPLERGVRLRDLAMQSITPAVQGSRPFIERRRCTCFSSRALPLQLRHLTALESMYPFASSYHHRCCSAVQVSSVPQSAQTKSRST